MLELKKVKFARTSPDMIPETISPEDPPHSDAVTYQEQKHICCISKELTNIILLGLGFMFSMGSYTTCALSQTVILNSVKDEYYQGTPTSGYTCLCLVYTSISISFLISPSLSAVLGPKPALVLGAVFLFAYNIPFLRPLTVTLYIASIIQGIGQGLIWTVYGHFLTENSNEHTLGRNQGIFWCLFQSSLIFGNLFYFFVMQGVEIISQELRTLIFSVLIGTALLGIFTLALMRHPWKISATAHPAKVCTPTQSERRKVLNIFLQNFVTVRDVALSKDMQYLLPAFIFVGLELTFYINVYGTSLEYTSRFGIIRQSLVGLNGVFIGLGQFFGGLLFGALGKFSSRYGRDIGVVFGFLVHSVAFFLIFLNIPADAPLKETHTTSFIAPNPYLAMFCAALLGLGDAAWINQIVALLGKLYRGNDCMAAFAWFQFLQCFGTALGFFYTPFLNLHYQLVILVASAVLGLAGFCALEWRTAAVDRRTSDLSAKTALETRSLLEKQRQSPVQGILMVEIEMHSNKQ